MSDIAMKQEFVDTIDHLTRVILYDINCDISCKKYLDIESKTFYSSAKYQYTIVLNPNETRDTVFNKEFLDLLEFTEFNIKNNSDYYQIIDDWYMHSMPSGFWIANKLSKYFNVYDDSMLLSTNNNISISYIDKVGDVNNGFLLDVLYINEELGYFITVGCDIYRLGNKLKLAEYRSKYTSLVGMAD